APAASAAGLGAAAGFAVAPAGSAPSVAAAGWPASLRKYQHLDCLTGSVWKCQWLPGGVFPAGAGKQLSCASTARPPTLPTANADEPLRILKPLTFALAPRIPC